MPELINSLLAIFGGTATLVFFTSLWSAWHAWKQTREFEEQTAVLLRLWHEVKLLRGEVFKRGRK